MQKQITRDLRPAILHRPFAKVEPSLAILLHRSARGPLRDRRLLLTKKDRHHQPRPCDTIERAGVATEISLRPSPSPGSGEVKSQDVVGICRTQNQCLREILHRPTKITQQKPRAPAFFQCAPIFRIEAKRLIIVLDRARMLAARVADQASIAERLREAGVNPQRFLIVTQRLVTISGIVMGIPTIVERLRKIRL